ncbi:MAG: ABC transporter permease [Thermoplasmata archaeon]
MGSTLVNIVDRVRRSTRLKLLLILGPPISYLAILFFAPFGLVVLYSFGLVDSTTKQLVFPPTVRWYEMTLTNISFLKVFARTLGYSMLTTFLTLLLGYPAAYHISFKARRFRDTMLILFIIPFWVSFLLRTYGLMTMLSESGIINTFLQQMGVISQPLALLHNDFAVVLGMAYNYLPLMVLPLYGSIGKLDRSLLEASATLGAGPLTTFRKVTLPLTMPGILAGTMLVFIPATGEFVIPSLMGGTQNYMIGQFIYEVWTAARVPALGSAVGLLFIAFVVVVLLVLVRYSKVEEAVVF